MYSTQLGQTGIQYIQAHWFKIIFWPTNGEFNVFIRIWPKVKKVDADMPQQRQSGSRHSWMSLLLSCYCKLSVAMLNSIILRDPLPLPLNMSSKRKGDAVQSGVWTSRASLYSACTTLPRFGPGTVHFGLILMLWFKAKSDYTQRSVLLVVIILLCADFLGYLPQHSLWSSSTHIYTNI